jgi:hypothetical protein
MTDNHPILPVMPGGAEDAAEDDLIDSADADALAATEDDGTRR